MAIDVTKQSKALGIEPIEATEKTPENYITNAGGNSLQVSEVSNMWIISMWVVTLLVVSVFLLAIALWKKRD